MSNETLKDHREKTESAPSNRKRPIYILATLVLVVFAFGLFTSLRPSTSQCYINSDLKTTDITLGQKIIKAEVVVNDDDQAKGLSDRSCLGKNAGMLFSFKELGNLCFWMKDMNFSIDMIWLDSDKNIVDIKGDASPESYPDEKFCPSEPAQYVLEISSGLSNELGLNIGDQLSFN